MGSCHIVESHMVIKGQQLVAGSSRNDRNGNDIVVTTTISINGESFKGDGLKIFQCEKGVEKNMTIQWKTDYVMTIRETYVGINA